MESLVISVDLKTMRRMAVHWTLAWLPYLFPSYSLHLHWVTTDKAPKTQVPSHWFLLCGLSVRILDSLSPPQFWMHFNDMHRRI